jgi:hypothetical protein
MIGDGLLANILALLQRLVMQKQTIFSFVVIATGATFVLLTS